MTLQELKFLIALAEQKHFGKASKSCFVSQPTLSVAISKLEKELGVTLFERDRHEVRITALGKKIVECAKRTLFEADNLKLIAQNERDPLSEVFKLGVIYTIGPYLLPPLLTSLKKIAPNMPIEIEENFTANLKVKLNRGDLDAIIISLPFSAPNVVTRPLYKEPLVVLMPGRHPLHTKKEISQTDLLPYHLLILGEGHCFRDQVISSCPKCFASNIVTQKNWQSVSGTSLETIRHMVAANMGLTILPKTAAMVSVYEKQFLISKPLKEKGPERIVAIAWRKSYPRYQAIEAMLKAMEESHLIGATPLQFVSYKSKK